MKRLKLSIKAQKNGGNCLRLIINYLYDQHRKARRTAVRDVMLRYAVAFHFTPSYRKLSAQFIKLNKISLKSFSSL